MPRVTIRYTADLEEVPSITSGLFEEAVEGLKAAVELVEQCSRNSENRARVDIILEAVESAREVLIKADQSMSDATDLLSGYESAKRSLEAAEEPEAPPMAHAPAAPPPPVPTPSSANEEDE